jgi:hypothetical protein
MQPGAPNWEQRIEVHFGQTAEIAIMTIGQDVATPAFDVYVSREQGTTVKLLFVSKDNVHVFTRPKGEGFKECYLKFDSDVLRIFPGTYIVRVFRNGGKLVEKYMSVLDSPTSQVTVAAQAAGSTSGIDVKVTDTDDGSVMVYRKDAQRFETTNEPTQLDMDGGRF